MEEAIFFRYQEIQKKVVELAIKCGRRPEDITLLAVSKGISIDKMKQAYEIGCRQFGESRVQEGVPKIHQLPLDIFWHFIGTLQSNKINKVIGEFSLIHSVDTLNLARQISDASRKRNMVTSILLEVNISGESTKHGLQGTEWMKVVDELNELSHLKIEGLMTIAPNLEDVEIIRNCFRGLRELKNEMLKRVKNPEIFQHLSMGMSHDYPIAIEEGATILRIGSAIFGDRNL